MDLNKYPQEVSIPAPGSSRWISFAWDGCYYYLISQSSNKIYRYNSSCECDKQFDTHRQYNQICYDFGSKCFWASSKTCLNTIFKLNHRLQEIDKLWIPPNCGIGGIVTGLSYNCSYHTLLVAFSDGIVSLDPVKETFEILNKLHGGCVTGILSIYPGYVVTQETRRGQYVRLFDHCHCEIQKKLIPASLRVEQILYDPCHKDPVFYSLITKKKCYSVISFQCVSSETLGFQIDSCYCKHCKHCFPCTEQEIAGCHDDVSVMQSVALMEAALSHILNAEGEKLQKVLAETDDIHTIMCVNEQVTQTIIHATHLENILYDKLAVLQKICCDRP